MTDSELPKLHVPGKPRYTTIAEDVDFYTIFEKIEAAYDICFYLESLGEEGNRSRYSLIGFDPSRLITATTKQELEIRDCRTGESRTYATENPYEALRGITPQHVISRQYAGGLVGYLGYDCVNFFEPSLSIQESDLFEPFKFGFYKDGLIFDKMTNQVLYFYYDEDRLPEVHRLMHEGKRNEESVSVRFLGNTCTREQHAEAVEKVSRDIRDGLVFQAEVGFKSKYRIRGNALKIYERLREYNPSPHMYYVKFGDQKIIGASPELLFRLMQGEMETYPLAGTINRGKTHEEDLALARRLLNDPKEIAEHNMLVDLHRNDIGRVARFGTVKVRNLMDIKRFSHVQHISSEICGIIRKGEDMFSALASNFPAGTLTGAPKIEAMKIINSMEDEGRGPYGGAVGQFCFNGDCNFAIPIRSIFMKGEDAYVQTCGGIVYDSVAENEYEEIVRKLSATKNILDGFADENPDD